LTKVEKKKEDEQGRRPEKKESREKKRESQDLTSEETIRYAETNDQMLKTLIVLMNRD
jgi:hypothetical protein